MDADQENKLSMYEAVYDFGQDPAWAPLIATVADVANGFVQVGYLLDPITGIVSGGGGSSAKQITSKAQGEGATADKKARRQTLAETAMPVAGPLFALGAALGDNEISAVADTTEAKLLKLRDGILGSRCSSIHTLATLHAAALVPKGVTALMLTDLLTAITDWDDKVQRPRQHKAAATGEKVVIEQALAALDDFVKKQLDKMMLVFKKPHPSFYAAYKAARVIHDTNSPGAPPAPPPTP